MRFNNHTWRPGWLPPSQRHRIDMTTAWISRLCRFAPALKARHSSSYI
ncbi:RRXRR domain-containing protein [Janthinobacterium sp. NKUCC06_STL]|nr:RRXRR domain-containing protein [Janthinobacterium sp. NKUCC06_STL]